MTERDFEEKVIKDKSFEHCLIKIFKKHCPGCEIASMVLQAMTNKLDNQGQLSDFPTFLVDLKNEIPWLGTFNYTPVIIYVRKDKETGEIIEMNTHKYNIRSMYQMPNENANLPCKLHMDAQWQIGQYYTKKTLAPDFDFDLDTKKEMDTDIKAS